MNVGEIEELMELRRDARDEVDKCEDDLFAALGKPDELLANLDKNGSPLVGIWKTEDGHAFSAERGRDHWLYGTLRFHNSSFVDALHKAFHEDEGSMRTGPACPEHVIQNI